MARRILTLSVTVVIAMLVVPILARAQYGTTTTTSPPTTSPPTTTTTAGGGGITVPSTVPPVTRPTLPGVTTTTLILRVGDLDLGALLSGNLARVLQTLNSAERSEAARRVAQIIEDILGDAGVDVNDITIVGGPTVEQGADPNAPITLSFSTDGYTAFALVTFIIESEPVLLGASEADENGRVSGTFELPSDLAPGEHTLSAIGEGPDGEPVVSRQTVRVAERPVADPSEDDSEKLEQAAAPLDDDGGSSAWIFIVVGVLVALALAGALTAAGRSKRSTTGETGT